MRSPGVRSLVTAFVLLKLGTLAVNAVAFPVLRPRRPVAWPRVSILVPARNEAPNLPRTLPGLLAQAAHEVIVLDDQSEDDTRGVARRLGARVIDGLPLPPGWLGKPWACQQLAAHATGDVLIFTDADVTWQEGTLGSIVDELLRSRADLLSVWPRHETGSLGERLVVPLVDDVLLTLLPAPLTRLPLAAAAAGSGQLMAFWRAPYQRLGGHGCVRAEVVEDVQIARRLKARGGRIAVALAGDRASVRLYRGYRELIPGFAKNLPAAHGNSMVLLLLSGVWHVLVYTVPFVAGWRRVTLLTLLERLLVNVKTGRTTRADLAEVLLTPLAPLASLPVYWHAMKRSYTWKGRTYDRKERRA